MRVLTVLVALLVTPLIASVAQDRPTSHRQVKRDTRDARRSDKHPAAGKSAAGKHADGDCEDQQGQHEGENDCGSTPPPPPPPQPPASAAELHGTVFADPNGTGSLGSTNLGIAGWLVTIWGPVNTAGSLTGSSDGAGNYAFTGLPAGTYLVCEASRYGYMYQTDPLSGPACPFGLGYSVTLSGGQVMTGLDFGNM